MGFTVKVVIYQPYFFAILLLSSKYPFPIFFAGVRAFGSKESLHLKILAFLCLVVVQITTLFQ